MSSSFRKSAFPLSLFSALEAAEGVPKEEGLSVAWRRAASTLPYELSAYGVVGMPFLTSALGGSPYWALAGLPLGLLTLYGGWEASRRLANRLEPYIQEAKRRGRDKEALRELARTLGDGVTLSVATTGDIPKGLPGRVGAWLDLAHEIQRHERSRRS